jgi:hypothetical protein
MADPELKKFHQDQADKMLLASFSSGLLGMPGRQVKYVVPSSVGEALNIATAVSQADSQDHRNEAFYLHYSVDRQNQKERGKYPNKNSATHNSSRNAPRRSNCSSSGEWPERKKNTCFTCGGVGHWAKECLMLKKQRNQPQKRRGEETKKGAKSTHGEQRRTSANTANRLAEN